MRNTAKAGGNGWLSTPVLLFIIVIVFIGPVFAAYALLQASRDGWATTVDRLKGSVGTVAASTDARLEQLVTSLEILATDGSLSNGADLGEFQKRAATIARHLGGWIFLVEAPPGSQTLLNTLRPSATPFSVGPPPLDSGRSRLLFTDGEPVVSDLYFGPVSGKLSVALGVPVKANGRVVAGLFLGLAPDRLGYLLRSDDVAPSQVATLVDGGHRIIDRSRDTTEQQTGMALPDWMVRATEGRGEGVMLGPGITGIDNVLAFQSLRRAPHWTVMVGEAQSYVLGTIWRPMIWTVSAGLSVTLVIGVLLWHFKRSSDYRNLAIRIQHATDQRLLSSLPAIVFLCDVQRDGRFKLLVKGGDFLRVCGWPSSEFLQPDAWSRHLDPTATTPEALFRRALGKGQAILEFRFRQPDGTWRWLRWELRRVSLRPDGSGEVATNITNIDDRMRVEKQAIAAARLSSLGEMAKGVAHELRQPLAAISMVIDNIEDDLRQDRDTSRIMKRIERAHRQIQRASQLIGDLSRFATGESYSGPVSVLVPYDHVRDVLRILAPQTEGMGIEVDNACDSEAKVIGYALALDAVLLNLVSNAIDAVKDNPPDTIRRITISTSKGDSEEELVISVADTGPGISEYVMERLFEPFVTTKGPDRGSGLGLALSRGLVTTMHGSIDAQNLEHGALFRVMLKSARSGQGTADDPILTRAG